MSLLESLVSLFRSNLPKLSKFHLGKDMYVRVKHYLGITWSFLFRMLGSPQWQGISAIVMIALTVAIFFLAQQVEESRYGQTIANINLIGADVVAFDTPEGNTTDQWMIVMQIQNSGPATAKEFVISLQFNGSGVTHLGSPEISSSSGSTSFDVIDEGGGSYKILIDHLFAYDRLFIRQNFSVQEPQNSEWRYIITEPQCVVQGQVKICSGGYIGTYYLDNGQRMLGLWGVGPGSSEFVRQITIIGDNVRQRWSWPSNKS